MKTMTLCAIACALLFYVIADAEMPWQMQVFLMWCAAAAWAVLMWFERDTDPPPEVEIE